MDEEKIVEAVARAICAEHCRDPDGTEGMLIESAPLVPDVGEPNWTAYEPVARAAWTAAKTELAKLDEEAVEPVVKAEFMDWGVYGGYTQQYKRSEWQRMRGIELGSFLRRWRAMLGAAPDQC